MTGTFTCPSLSVSLRRLSTSPQCSMIHSSQTTKNPPTSVTDNERTTSASKNGKSHGSDAVFENGEEKRRKCEKPHTDEKVTKQPEKETGVKATLRPSTSRTVVSICQTILCPSDHLLTIDERNNKMLKSSEPTRSSYQITITYSRVTCEIVNSRRRSVASGLPSVPRTHGILEIEVQFSSAFLGNR